MFSPEIRTGNAVQLHSLQQLLLRFSFFNLFLVAVLGLMLRSYLLADFFPFDYRNLLHGHSHFAFGGWIQPVLVWLILKYMPFLANQISYHHWRNIVWLTLFSAYGMLFSFPLEGYAAVSITFSTIAVAAGIYLSAAVWKASKKYNSQTAVRFLRTGLFFQLLSFAGPFAIGPLIAIGKAGSVLYFDAVYFYLHFQYNGWFLFAALAVLYVLLERQKPTKYGKRVHQLFYLSTVPAYCLSMLWHQPNGVFFVIGGSAAMVQLAGMFYFIKDAAVPVRKRKSFISRMLFLAGSAFVLKLLLQAMSALPFIASLAYVQRNFIIAYLHLVLLGCFSILFFALVLQKCNIHNHLFRWGFVAFFVAFITTEVLLVSQALTVTLHFYIPALPYLLFVCSVLFPAGAFLLFLAVGKNQQATDLAPLSIMKTKKQKPDKVLLL
jgi:hypothetical protein